MTDPFRYRVVDEPRPSRLARFSLPPTLVFIAATFFQPWGFLLVVLNSITLSGPSRNREILFALLPLPLYFGALVALNEGIRRGIVSLLAAPYLFVGAIGLGLVSAAFAYMSQEKTFQLRRYLNQLRGYAT